MSYNVTPSLLGLPIEVLYRILDQLDPKHILLSVRNVCQRLDAITDTYYPYQVNLTFDFSSDIHCFRFEVLFNTKIEYRLYVRTTIPEDEHSTGILPHM